MPAQTKDRHRSIRFIFMQDMIISLLASLLSILLVRWLTEPIPGFTFVVLKWIGAAAAGTLAGILITSSYKVVRQFATVRSIAKTLVALLIKEMAMVAILLWGGVKIASAYAVLAILADTMLSGGLLVYLRASARILLREPRDIKIQAHKRTALVAGTGAPSLKLAADLESEGYSVIGLLTHDISLSGRVINDLVVYQYDGESDIARLQWQLGGVDCVFFPREYADTALSAHSDDTMAQQDGMSSFEHIIKRCFDIALSSFLLLIFSPVIGLCALLVRREDGGPVFFKQERIGRGGVPFEIYKFRSMRVNAEQDGAPALYSGEEDPRLTRTGRFLRAHHLDELPQLWNVLRGDMSFIGYRPERQYYIDKIMALNARYKYLYQIRPGVTSYATLYNGYTDSLEKMITRLELDLYYLRNHNLLFDAKVLGLTFLSIISGKKF